MIRTLGRAFNAQKLGELRGGFIPPFVNHAGPPLSRLLLWTCSCSVLLALAFVLDSPAERLLTLSGPSEWTRVVGLMSKTGEGWVIAVFGIFGACCLFWGHRFTAGGGVFLMAMSGLLTGAAATIIRSLLGRTRPSSHELQGFYGVWHDSHWIIGKYEFGAFPSGHAATVIGFAAAAWLINRRWGCLATIYALVISWSRVALGCHHLSDIAAAAILGIAGAYLLVTRLGPPIYAVVQTLETAWMRKHTPSDPETRAGAL